MGAFVTPADPAATGEYEIGVFAGGRDFSFYPDADVVVSAKFWPLNQEVGVLAGGVKQQEHIQFLGTITTSGTSTVVVTAVGMTGTPITVNPSHATGVQQVETLTVAGTVSSSGNATVICTAAGMTGSPITVSVAVLSGDTASDVGGKVRTALSAHSVIGGTFGAISGATTDVVWTKDNKEANDTTMNISIDNGTCAGLTPVLTSVNTTAGVASDGPVEIAESVRAALAANVNISNFFTITKIIVPGGAAGVTLTALNAAANDATMNFSIANNTCAGITEVTNSTNVRAGVAPNPFKSNLLEISAGFLNHQSSNPHSYWYCYQGWNQSGMDPDGVPLVEHIMLAIGLYNATPYTLTWGIDRNRYLHASDPLLGTPYYCNTFINLPPGGVAVAEGVNTATYYITDTYYAVPVAYYGERSGVTDRLNYLHVQCTNEYPGYGYSGYLEVVLIGRPIV